jgi:tetratricopeptide (TPR) repeat protein
MTVAGACVLALAALAVAAPAAHAEVAAPLEIDACPPRAVDLPEATLIERAGQAYDRGEVLYVQGDYAAAIDAFVESYCTVPYYTVLKDVGQAYERLLEYERAIAYLERYVASVPDDATRGGPCAPEPREDRANVAARVRVLAGLPAKLRITTSPDGARVTLRRGDTVVARVVTGQGILEARAGTYAMTIERDGFEPITTEVTAAIGKPYSYYFQLTPRRGTLRCACSRPTPGSSSTHA